MSLWQQRNKNEERNVASHISLPRISKCNDLDKIEIELGSKRHDKWETTQFLNFHKSQVLVASKVSIDLCHFIELSFELFGSFGLSTNEPYKSCFVHGASSSWCHRWLCAKMPNELGSMWTYFFLKIDDVIGDNNFTCRYGNRETKGKKS